MLCRSLFSVHLVVDFLLYLHGVCKSSQTLFFIRQSRKKEPSSKVPNFISSHTVQFLTATSPNTVQFCSNFVAENLKMADFTKSSIAVKRLAHNITKTRSTTVQRTMSDIEINVRKENLKFSMILVTGITVSSTFPFHCFGFLFPDRAICHDSHKAGLLPERVQILKSFYSDKTDNSL